MSFIVRFVVLRISSSVISSCWGISRRYWKFSRSFKSTSKKEEKLVSRNNFVLDSTSFVSYEPCLRIEIETCMTWFWDRCFVHRTIFQILFDLESVSYIAFRKSSLFTLSRVLSFRLRVRTNSYHVLRHEYCINCLFATLVIFIINWYSFVQ